MLSALFLTSGVSKICLTWMMLVSCQVYLVKVPSGSASLRMNATVELGSRFFRDPDEIRCWSMSKKTWGMWNTRGSGLPVMSLKKERVQDLCMKPFQFVWWYHTTGFKDLIVISESAAQRLAFQWWLPQFPSMHRLAECEQSRFNGQANTAWGPRQVRGNHSNFQIVRLPVGLAQSAFSNTAWQNEIGDRQWAVSLHAADSLITNVSLLLSCPQQLLSP